MSYTSSTLRISASRHKEEPPFMKTRPPVTKAERILCVLVLLSIPVYGLALFMGGTFTWLYIGYALVIMAWIAIFVLPSILKQFFPRQKRRSTHR